MVALLLTTITAVFQFTPVNAQETLIWSQWVYSSGDVVTGPVLTAGKTYRIVASEIFWYDYGYPDAPSFAADAQYYTTGTNSWVWQNYEVLPDGHSFLQINGENVDWGPFSNGVTLNPLVGHTYSIEYTGTGAAVTFQIIDWMDNDYCNNVCHLPVEIYEIPETPECGGLTPGFWKNHLGAWEGRSPTDFFEDIFDVDITINQGKKTANNAPTLLDALEAKGGVNENKMIYDALARHAVAALLNAAHPDINYPWTEEEIISAVHEAIEFGITWNPEQLKDQLDTFNNLGADL